MGDVVIVDQHLEIVQQDDQRHTRHGLLHLRDFQVKQIAETFLGTKGLCDGTHPLIC